MNNWIRLQWILILLALAIFIFGWGYLFAIWQDYYQESLIIKADEVIINTK